MTAAAQRARGAAQLTEPQQKHLMLPIEGGRAAPSGLLLAKWRHLARAVRDPSLRGAPLAALFAVLDHIGPTDTDVFLNMDTIAREAGGLTRSNCSRAVRKLRDEGYLVVKQGGGRKAGKGRAEGLEGSANRYAMPDDMAAEQSPPVTVPRAAQSTPDIVPRPAQSNASETVPRPTRSGPVYCAAGTDLTVPPATHNLGKVTLAKAPPSSPPSSAAALDREFAEQFWPRYPRRVDRAHAAKAWRAARRRASAAEIIAGLARFVESPAAGDPKFIPYPATWLNGDRWADEPDRPARRGAETAVDAALALHREVLERTGGDR